MGIDANALRNSWLLAPALIIVGCSSSSGSGDGGIDAGKDGSSSGDAGPLGGPLSGAQDAHCVDPDGGAKVVVPIDPAACMPEASADAGMTMGDGGMEPMPETMFNSEGEDDDCKYHIQWSVMNAGVNREATFTVTLSALATGKPVSNAGVDPEVYLDMNHPAPPTTIKTAETSPGTYTMGPVAFDATGKWTVRFHFFPTCLDSPESPHGHAAFFLGIP
jgi:hypothetical protein